MCCPTMCCLSLRVAAWGRNTCGISSLGKTKANPTVLSRCGESGGRERTCSKQCSPGTIPPSWRPQRWNFKLQWAGREKSKRGWRSPIQSDHRGTKANNQRKQSTGRQRTPPGSTHLWCLTKNIYGHFQAQILQQGLQCGGKVSMCFACWGRGRREHRVTGLNFRDLSPLTFGANW